MRKISLSAAVLLAIGVIAIIAYALARCEPTKCEARLLATALLIAGGWFATGWLLGFVFGFPRAPSQLNAEHYQPSSNLEHISDWLTKLLLGAGLAQLSSVQSIGEFFGRALGEGPEATILAASIILLFSIAGFVLGFLWTNTSYAEILQRSRQTLGRIAREADKELQDEVEPDDPRELAMTPAPSAVSILSRRVRQGNVDPAQVSASEVRTIGLSLFRESDYLRSTPYLLAAYRAAPDDSEVAVRYAIALGEQGRLQDAIDVLLDLRKRNRATPGTPKLLGYYLLWFATRLNEAIAYTEEYLQARPDDEGALMNLACGYAQRSARDGDPGDKEKAIATLRRITKNPVWSKRLDELRHDDFTSFSDDDIRRAKNQA